jgi:anaerobic selenocysteine-containing dehydrogenase
LNSQYINLQRKGAKRVPALEINPDDAASRGIVDGARVKVFNDRGEVEVRASVSERTALGVVSLAFNWWPQSTRNGSSANALTADGLSAIGIGSDAFDTLVEVKPC